MRSVMFWSVIALLASVGLAMAVAAGDNVRATIAVAVLIWAICRIWMAFE